MVYVMSHDTLVWMALKENNVISYLTTKDANQHAANPLQHLVTVFEKHDLGSSLGAKASLCWWHPGVHLQI